MENYWTDTTHSVKMATPRLIQGYGYLYIFDCEADGRNFVQMSQIFVPKELRYDPIGIYKHFKNLDSQFPISTITSLHRGQGRDEKWAIEKAKDFAKKQEENRMKAEKRVEDKEKERGEPASEEFKEEFFEMMKKKHPPKEASSWYNKYKESRK